MCLGDGGDVVELPLHEPALQLRVTPLPQHREDGSAALWAGRGEVASGGMQAMHQVG